MGSSAARQFRHDARIDLVASWGPEQGLLAEQSPEFAAYLATFAPLLSWKSTAYARRTWTEAERRGERVMLFGRPRDLRRAIAAAFVAGVTGEPDPIDEQIAVQSVHLGYRRLERVRFVNLDLDGKDAPPAKILAALRANIGEDSMLVISGSGQAGRYRVLLRLDKSKTVDALKTLVTRWIEGLGFKLGNDFEVFPSTKPGRLPFGLGGCTRFSIDLKQSRRERPIDLCKAFAALKPINLRALALRFPERPPPAALPASKKPKQRLPQLQQLQVVTSPESLPRRYVADRRPPTPKATRELWNRGIEKGERDDARYRLAKDLRYRGYSKENAIDEIRAWIEEGNIDASRELQRPSGKTRQLRDVARVVARVYETHELPGRPEPVPLTSGEAARIAELAGVAAVAYGFSENAIRALLHGILPLFKAARIAGLPHVRIHTKEWKQAGGSRVAKLRDACGIFAPTTGYRTERSLLARGLKSKAAAEHAYAKSWETSFSFDL